MQEFSNFVEVPQSKLLSSIIEQQNNIYVVGPPGSGKTTTVNYTLQKKAMPCKRINQF